MIRTFLHVMACLLMASVQAHAQTQTQRDMQRDVPRDNRDPRTYIETNQAGANARIDILGNTWRTPFAIGAGQTRMVVYRTADSALPGATSVFVNNEYHASLVPGGYSELCYAPGSTEIGARQMQAGGRPKDPLDTISALTLRPGQTHYLKVREQGGRPVMQPIAAATAQQELQGLRFQQHVDSF